MDDVSWSWPRSWPRKPANSSACVVHHYHYSLMVFWNRVLRGFLRGCFPSVFLLVILLLILFLFLDCCYASSFITGLDVPMILFLPLLCFPCFVVFDRFLFAWGRGLSSDWLLVVISVVPRPWLLLGADKSAGCCAFLVLIVFCWIDCQHYHWVVSHVSIENG